MRIEANASKREQRLLADYAEREHFRAAEGWSIEANAIKRGQSVQARSAERELLEQPKAGQLKIKNYPISLICPICHISLRTIDVRR